MDKRFVAANCKKINKTSRIEVAILNSIFLVSKKDINSTLIDAFISTIGVILNKMLKEGKIIKVGEGVDTEYFKK